MLEELIDLARATSLYVADLNLQTREHFQKSASITQAQLDYLTNVLKPPLGDYVARPLSSLRALLGVPIARVDPPEHPPDEDDPKKG